MSIIKRGGISKDAPIKLYYVCSRCGNSIVVEKNSEKNNKCEKCEYGIMMLSTPKE